MQSLNRPILPLALLTLLVACGPADDENGPGSGVVLRIEPAEATLYVENGQSAQQSFEVFATYPSGNSANVTQDVTLTLEQPTLGSFSGNVFEAFGAAGGTSTLRATLGDSIGEGQVTVFVRNDRVDEGVPADAPGLFDGAANDPALAPTIVYPQTGTYFPPNLGDFEAHYQGPQGANLYEVSLESAHTRVRVYTRQNNPSQAFTSLQTDEWSTIGNSARGAQVTLTVRSMDENNTSRVGSSEGLPLRLTNDDIRGGIYYWASPGALPGGVYRHDMSRPGQPAEPFYTNNQNPDSSCVGCHTLSRNGEKMALTFDHAGGRGGVVDVASKNLDFSLNGNLRWDFATFDPDGEKLVTVSDGVLTLRNANTGAAINTIPVVGRGSHVDFSPLGDQVAFAQHSGFGNDISFSNASIAVSTFDAATNTWGASQVIYQVPSGFNAYYPTYSPDGQWILFTQCQGEDSYDANSAEIFVIDASGNSPAVRLDSPNLGPSLTNSWARWAPFSQTATTENGSEQFFWLTFSSKRAFGVRTSQGKPQVWMSPFFPGRLSSGADPSGPAFRLPMQDLTTNNHIAQWTTQVVDSID